MAKVDDVELRGLGQELIDWKDNVTEIINFGKFQFPIVSTVPNYVGRRGEMVWFINGTDGGLYMAGSDLSTTWSNVVNFVVQPTS